jgi:hypothetical protein
MTRDMQHGGRSSTLQGSKLVAQEMVSVEVISGNPLEMVRPERFELPTLWFVAKCSIQLSYGRAQHKCKRRFRL